MTIYDSIRQFFRRGSRLRNVWGSYAFGGWDGRIGAEPFADVFFLNCCELLTDITHDVTWQFSGRNPGVESAFVRFFNAYGKMVLNMLFRDGVVVIGHTQSGEGPTAAHAFHVCQSKEYTKRDSEGWTTYTSRVEGMDVYAIQSSTYAITGSSDRAVLAPVLNYLDNALNASNTVSKRLGALIVASPKNLSNAPTPIELDEDEAKDIEKKIQEGYGALSQQSQFMVLPREMAFQVISLASLDLKTNDKVKTAVLTIADRLKVPANQVGVIDANSSKSLSNGSELREGDINKYQSFERLLDQTWVQLARDCGLEPGATDVTQGVAVGSYYTIYNKPTAKAPAQTETA